ncbi:SDR family NAD(P)-dependent oxidoreductase [Pseudoxanthomonas suwonensis]|uniref:SDR family NAD(P)-dependent oxidoreductase n=1 Tax=Pseudoxanthomonas suwonensis TaxID=314722 RepID=UPI00138F0C74|nr:SDR family oxidoreductase [Pseudoxanthomonas suwonensis]KAF1701811.1 short-chain dehydrogenase [Pseudoxanthomonas suwonensis]
MDTPVSPVTLITGGSRGLGRNAATHLARAGHDLILTYRSQSAEAEAAAAELQALGRRVAVLPLDVADSGSFAAFAARVREVLAGWGRQQFEHLVNNAGTGLHVPFAQTTEAQLDEMYRIHFKGPYLLTQALLPLIADGGRILNISSGLARFSVPGTSAYGSMKGAVEVLTRYLARELGERRISVNTLAPGAIETDFGGGRLREDRQLNAWVASQTPLGRVGQPDDIGGAVAALLEPGTAWINGQRIEASGGMLV